MKTWILIGLLVAGAGLAGCSGVIMNATYSGLLDQTAAWSQDRAYRAEANALTVDELKKDARTNAELWLQFKCAREGRGGL